MTWIQLITAGIQLIMMILKNRFEKDAEKKKAKEILHAEVTEAIKARDAVRTAAILVQLHSS